MAKYIKTWGFPSVFSGTDEEGILLRVLIQILNETAETNRLLRLILATPNKGQTSNDGVDATV